MAIRVNPVTGQMQMVKEQTAQAAKMAHEADLTVIDQLKKSGPPSLTMDEQVARTEPDNVVKFSLPENRKGRVDRKDEMAQAKEEADRLKYADLAQQQRELERVKALSEHDERYKDLDTDPQAIDQDGLGQQIIRTDRFNRMFRNEIDGKYKALESGARVGGAYLTANQTEGLKTGDTLIKDPEQAKSDATFGELMFLEGQEQQEGFTGPYINPDSTKGILFDPLGFNVGVQGPGGVTQVDPVFGRVMGFVTEKFLYHTDSSIDTDRRNQIETLEEYQKSRTISMKEQGKFDPSATEQQEESLKRGTGNSTLGREIFKAWKREKNLELGRPSDEYTDENVTNDQFEVIGTLAKEMFYAANPELLKRVSDPLERKVEYLLTPVGAKAIRAAAAAAPDAFINEEIPPSLLPRKSAKALGEGEAGRNVKTKTTHVVNRVIPQVEEARGNMNYIPHMVGTLKRKLFIQVAIDALSRIKKNTALPKSGDLLKIGPKKLIGFRNELDKKRYELEKKAAAEERRNPESQALAALPRDQEGNPIVDYDFRFEMEKQIVRLLEGLNTIGKYSNKALHLDFVVQELQTRMHAAQNRFNPQLIPWIRFVTGGVNPINVKPNSGSKPELIFKEQMAAFFIKGADKLLPKERIKAFDREWRLPGHGKFGSFIAEGKAIKESLMSPEEDKKAIEQLKNINYNAEVGNVEIPPSLEQTAKLNISDSFMEILRKEELEGMYLIEAAHELHEYNQADISNSSFMSNMSIEIDGKTHGPATNLMLLGSVKAAHRVGVLRRPDAEKNLDSFTIAELYKGVETDVEMQAGDLRDGMGFFMEENGQNYAQNFIQNTDASPYLYKILQLALKDRDNFLKKPPMTLNYGQLLKNLAGSVEETVFVGKSATEIKKIMNDPALRDVLHNKARGGQLPEQVVVEFLHNILADAIDSELDPNIVRVGTLLRANNVVAMLSDEIITIPNAIGVDTFIGGRQSYMRENKGNINVFFPKGSDVAKASGVPLYGSAPAGSAMKDGAPGGIGRSRIIASVVQGIDGAWMNKTYTGKSWQALNKYYMLPIMDAVKTDLAGAYDVREHANRNWWETIKEYSYLDHIMGNQKDLDGWTPTALKKLRSKLTNIGSNEVEIGMDNEYRSFFWLLHQVDPTGSSEPIVNLDNLESTIYDTMEYPDRKRGVSVKDYEDAKRKAATVIAQGIFKKTFPSLRNTTDSALGGLPPFKTLTGSQLLTFAENIFGPEGLNVEARNKITQKSVDEKKQELVGKVIDKDVFQIDIG